MAKILIIDDSGLSRRMMRKILEEASHEVVEAGDGFAALEIFTLENPRVVMLDLTMPGINGFDVLTQLKTINPDSKVVIASADIQSLTKDMAKQKGADGFVNKPFVQQEIIDIVELLTGEGKI
jgi:CheY-like chemotaxis protein